MTADSKNEAAFDYLAAASKVALKLAETAVERDEKGAHPHQEIGLLREAGLLELVAPIELGGHGVRWIGIRATLDGVPFENSRTL